MAYKSSKVLVGNWRANRISEEADEQLYLLKYQRNELLLQKSRQVFSNLLKERMPRLCGESVRFGYQAQLIATQFPGEKRADKFVYGLALSGLLTEKQVDFMEQLSDGCLLTLSPITTACCRNTFTIVSDDPQDSKEGDRLRFGADFLLQIADYSNTARPPLYVRYDYSSVPDDKDTMTLRLSERPDRNCRFQVYPLNMNERYSLMGQPVPVGRRVVITNCAANKNLYVMYNLWFPTFFGAECGVKLETCFDQHKRYVPENIFLFKSEEEKTS